MPVLPRIFNALCDASNSTGNVTIWNNTASENARIPRLINNTEVVLLLKKNPRMISGHAIELPKFATGTRLLLNFNGTYPVACCTACPHFSVITLDDSSQYDLYTRSADAVRIVAEHPANQFQNISGDIKVHRLLTFLFQECARDFYFRGEQHEAFELVCVDLCFATRRNRFCA